MRARLFQPKFLKLEFREMNRLTILEFVFNCVLIVLFT